MVRISEWLRDCTTLFSFLDPRSLIIETQDSILASWDSILASRNSKRSSLETQESSYEFRGSSVNLLLSGTVSIILYIPDWKNIAVLEVYTIDNEASRIYGYICSLAKQILSSQVYIVMSFSCGCNPWSALFKAYNCVFMQSAKKALRSYLMFSSVCYWYSYTVEISDVPCTGEVVSLSPRKLETVCTFLECIIAKSFDN